MRERVREGGETRSESVPADAHVDPQLQRGAVATLVFVPPHRHQHPSFKSGVDPPSLGQHMRRCHAAGHTLCLAPLKSNPAERRIEQSERHWGGEDVDRTLHMGQDICMVSKEATRTQNP